MWASPSCARLDGAKWIFFFFFSDDGQKSFGIENASLLLVLEREKERERKEGWLQGSSKQ